MIYDSNEIHIHISEERIIGEMSEMAVDGPVYKKIPVLLHHGKPIVESLFIIEYIDKTWKHNPILPADPYERAMVRSWARLMDETGEGAVVGVPASKFALARLLLEGSKRVLYLEGDQLKKEIEQVSDAMAVLEGMLKGKKFFGGEMVGFLDIAFGWTTVWLEAIEEVAGVEFFNRDKYPHLDNWKNEFKEIHAVKDSLFPMERLVRFFKNNRQSQLKLAAQK
ncbi:Glutathione S-transferase tau 7 [Theobroma cacao]|uniref:glutathione transferase n=1 Tax=Theobroma cacao TaxID=3641 RepID=A0A061EZL3_THECC|nr:Glutathione S-transferase tau 7 [Theobroma cacao]